MGNGVFFWRYADTSSMLDSGQHLNSYHWAIFLKLDMETTYLTHFFAKANPRQTNSSFALLMKTCVLCWWARHLKGVNKGWLILEQTFQPFLMSHKHSRLLEPPALLQSFSANWLFFTLLLLFCLVKFLSWFNLSFEILTYTSCNLYLFRRMKRADWMFFQEMYF